MNMILHNHATAEIKGGSSTLADPHFKDGGGLKSFDFVVANPPFSDKRWTTGFSPDADEFRRFSMGVPPSKQGDYAYLLHIIASLKSTGQGACILPHGVLFRGNAEAVIRKNLIQRGYIKGIIGLPTNLFYGTGIPACIVVIDKAGATDRKHIFMIDASKSFKKDGNKNRLREQDIHKVVDTFTRQDESNSRYARLVPISEISDPKNDFNLNLPRYIDSTEPEDIQDIDAHLNGGIPERDLDALAEYWDVMPGVRNALFAPVRPGYVELKIENSDIKPTIFGHPEFSQFTRKAKELFTQWQSEVLPQLREFGVGGHPKPLIEDISEKMLTTFRFAPLIDTYDVYQHLMDYWAETMQDDSYVVAAEGWKAEIEFFLNKKGKTKGWTCDLVPRELVIARYFQAEQDRINEHESKLEAISAELTEMEEEQSGEEGVFSDLEKVSLASVKAHMKAMAKESDGLLPEEVDLLKRYLELAGQEQTVKQWLKAGEIDLDQKLLTKYKVLTEDEVRVLVVEDKWLATLANAVQGELDRVSQSLTGRIRLLAERYATPLPQLTAEIESLSARVDEHLQKMGAVWR